MEIFFLLCLRTEEPQGSNFASFLFSALAYLDHVYQGSEVQQP